MPPLVLRHYLISFSRILHARRNGRLHTPMVRTPEADTISHAADFFAASRRAMPPL